MSSLAMPAITLRHAASPNHDARPAGVPIDTLLLQTTRRRDGSDVFDRLRDPAAGNSAHYLVQPDGRIWQLVPEQRRAWHAGDGHWRGHAALDDRSVAIEIAARDMHRTIGHSPRCRWLRCASCAWTCSAATRSPRATWWGTATWRPGPSLTSASRFDWRGLAANGVGLWPAPGPDAVTDVAAALATIGYRTDLPEAVLLRAFQRHWRPERVNGLADIATRRLLAAVSRAAEPPPPPVPS